MYWHEITQGFFIHCAGLFYSECNQFYLDWAVTTADNARILSDSEAREHYGNFRVDSVLNQDLEDHPDAIIDREWYVRLPWEGEYYVLLSDVAFP